MNNGLAHLLLRRYWKMMVLLLVVLVGNAVYVSATFVGDWKLAYSYYHSDEFKKMFNEDEEIKQDGKIYLYSKENGEEVYTNSYQEYVDFNATVFNESGFYSYDLTGGYFYTTAIVAAIAGCLLFMFDLKTHFNTLLFSSRFSKKSIYFMKHLLVTGTFVLSLIISKIVYLAILLSNIPEKYLNAGLMELMPSVVVNVLALATTFIAASLLGLVLGEWISGLGTVAFFFVTFDMFTSQLYAASEQIAAYYEKTNQLWPFINMLTTPAIQPRVVHPGEVALPLLLSGCCLLAGAALYQRLSLENNGNYLMFDKLRKPMQLLIVIYTVMLFRLDRHVRYLFPLSFETPGNFFSITAKTLGFGAMVYVLTDFLIYRRIPFKQHLLKWVKRAQ